LSPCRRCRQEEEGILNENEENPRRRQQEEAKS
jgi:hypothetical protein